MKLHYEWSQNFIFYNQVKQLNECIELMLYGMLLLDLQVDMKCELDYLMKDVETLCETC